MEPLPLSKISLSVLVALCACAACVCSAELTAAPTPRSRQAAVEDVQAGTAESSTELDFGSALQNAARIHEKAAAELALGRLAEAEVSFRALVALEAEIWGPDAAIRIPNMEVLAGLQLDLHQFEQAEQTYQETLRICEVSDEGDYRALEALRWLAALRLSVRDLVTAERHWHRTAKLRAEALGPRHPLTIAAHAEVDAIRARRAGKVADLSEGDSSPMTDSEAEAALDRLAGAARRAARSSLLDTVSEVMARRLGQFKQGSTDISAAHQAVWEDQGFAQLALGRPARALGSYHSALRMANQRLGQRDPALRPLLEITALCAVLTGSDSVAQEMRQRIAQLESR